MKKLKRLKLFKLLVAFTMICLIGTAFFRSLLVMAEQNEKKLSSVVSEGSLKVSVSINDVPIAEVKNPKYEDVLYGILEWSFEDETIITKDDVLVYDLPAQIKFTENEGIIPDENKNQVGTYSIKQDKIVIQYTSDEFLEGNNKKSSLTFSGTLNGDGTSATEQKDVEITFEALGTFNITVMPLDKNSDLGVTKKFENYDPDNYVYTCYISVTSSSANSNVLIYDEMYPGMSLYGGSPKIYKDSDYTVNYEGLYEGFDEKAGATKLNAKIASMTDEEVIYIKYMVKVDPKLYDWSTVDKYLDSVVDCDKFYPNGYEGKVPNKVEVRSTQVPKRTAWADIYTLRYSFQKWNNEKDNKVKEGKLSWQFDINYIKDDVTSGWIIDTIPANSSFVMEEDEITLSIKGGQLLGAAYDYISIEEIEGDSGEPQVKIIFKDALLDVLRNNAVLLQYYTKVDKQEDDTAWYSNYAELFLNGISQGKRHNEMEYTKPDELTKTGKYNATTAPNVNYRIDINPAAFDINPYGDTIILKDTMGSALDLDISSIRVNGKEVSSNDLSFDPDTRTFTLDLLDNTAYVITYNAVVNLSAGEVMNATNASNVCELVGISVKGGDKPTVIEAVVYESSASSSVDKDSVSIKIVKHDSENVASTLEGVTFRLERVTLSGNKIASSKVEKASLITDSDGTIEVDGLKRNVVYCLTELKTVAGYELESTPVYFVFVKNIQNDFPSVVEVGNEEYEVNIVDKSKAKATFYVANKKKEVASDDVLTTETQNNDKGDNTTDDSTSNTTDTTAGNTTDTTTVTTESTPQSSTETTFDSDSKQTSEANNTTEKKNDGKKDSKADNVVKTGDDTPIMPIVFILCGSLLALIGLYDKKKSMF